ncbi:MAG: hypothetical protein FWE11_01355 [Defluviitaleaceae bacterium]|nr:hypothetical protein [Defluviitaleaceae bacterium]
MDPKVVILVVVIFAAVVIAVLTVQYLVHKFTESDRNHFKCVHCKGKFAISDKDAHFSRDTCKNCGEYIIPGSSRKQS